MRYRKLDADGDYVAGPGAVFLVNSPETVAQAVETRMRLFTGEWFLDLDEGLNKMRILGNNTQGTRDQEVQQRILNTFGVKSILNYASQVDPNVRSFSVSATLDTIYGVVPVSISETF